MPDIKVCHDLNMAHTPVVTKHTKYEKRKHEKSNQKRTKNRRWELKQADNPPSVEVDVYVVEPRARRKARDGVDVPAQEVDEAGPDGRPYVAYEHLHGKERKKVRQQEA